jgi:hypothetical protein
MLVLNCKQTTEQVLPSQQYYTWCSAVQPAVRKLHHFLLPLLVPRLGQVFLLVHMLPYSPTFFWSL